MRRSRRSSPLQPTRFHRGTRTLEEGAFSPHPASRSPSQLMRTFQPRGSSRKRTTGCVARCTPGNFTGKFYPATLVATGSLPAEPSVQPSDALPCELIITAPLTPNHVQTHALSAFRWPCTTRRTHPLFPYTSAPGHHPSASAHGDRLGARSMSTQLPAIRTLSPRRLNSDPPSPAGRDRHPRPSTCREQRALFHASGSCQQCPPALVAHHDLCAES
ncbi:hypothetical protein OH76DRAFT_305116 [Lentinus brumalis]|uniref:Uncharacterized protein n=1 Tax=Lentinus brumalis TaxID=2498619 RepID=A0A371CKG2_9APHY|nr:hypothetical protein OH76DRAFT_305116 [Polyporus brumalis]